MRDNHKGKLKIIVVFGILFFAVSVLLLLIFYAGKKTYTVRFDLNGGTLISGSLEQYVTQGQNAIPPIVVKDGAYLHSWSASPNQVTKDMEIQAIWEYQTTTGIIYSSGGNQNFAEIAGAYKYIRGEVYLGAYYGDKKILGIRKNAFADCTGITKIYLLNGLISIEEGAFAGCDGLMEIEIPETVTHLGSRVFRGCESLESVVLNEGLLEIGSGAFEGCGAITEIVLPASLERIGVDAFIGCDDLVIKVNVTEENKPVGWADGWQGSATVVWLEDPEDNEAESNDGDSSETDGNTEVGENSDVSDTEGVSDALESEGNKKDIEEK